MIIHNANTMAGIQSWVTVPSLRKNENDLCSQRVFFAALQGCSGISVQILQVGTYHYQAPPADMCSHVMTNITCKS